MTSIGNSGIDVYPLALGGNTFGWTSDESASHQVLDAFVATGGNFVDTADGYSAWAPGNVGGESEQIIGSWLARRGNRSDVVIGTKVSQHPEFRGLSGANIVAAADASLRRLGTNYIDLYYAHFDDPTTPLAETVEAFHSLVVAGKIRAVGVSNFLGARIEAWIAIAAENGWTLPVAVQPHYNLVHREPFETQLAPIARAHSLGVVPYFSLASGFLTGKYRSLDDLKGLPRERMATPYFSEQGFAVLRELDAVARGHDSTIAAVALAWLLRQPGVVAPIASARNPGQLAELMAAPSLQLADAEVQLLERASSTIPA